MRDVDRREVRIRRDSEGNRHGVESQEGLGMILMIGFSLYEDWIVGLDAMKMRTISIGGNSGGTSRDEGNSESAKRSGILRYARISTSLWMTARTVYIDHISSRLTTSIRLLTPRLPITPITGLVCKTYLPPNCP